MVPLTTAANPLAARILAAHLGAEGIVWELRGNVDGPYPVGPVEVLVPAADLEVARALMAATEAGALALDDQADDD
jgi:Putative prokaryotic signal transducing protein